jgi:hypothetical protein
MKKIMKAMISSTMPVCNAKTYKWTDSRCRSFFLSKLGNNGNPHFKNINQKFTMDSRLTYQQLMDDINSLLKEKSKWDFIGSAPRSQTSTSQQRVNQISTNNRNIPANTLLCLNCGGTNHTVDNCMSKKCFECIKKHGKMYSFPTVEARRQHDSDLGHYVLVSTSISDNNSSRKRKDNPNLDNDSSNDSPSKSIKKGKIVKNLRTYGKGKTTTTTSTSKKY